METGTRVEIGDLEWREKQQVGVERKQTGTGEENADLQQEKHQGWEWQKKNDWDSRRNWRQESEKREEGCRTT